MTSQAGKQTIKVHILPNIFQNKDNQTMKFGQLLEHNMRKNFLKKSCAKYDGETIPEPFLENQSWGYLWINNLTLSTVYFFLCAKLRAIEICWN